MKVGGVCLTREFRPRYESRLDLLEDRHLILQSQLSNLETIMKCVEMSWPVLISGASGTGKSALIATAAALTGRHVEKISMTASTDIADLIGGYEQVDYNRHLRQALQDVYAFFRTCVNEIVESKASLLNDLLGDLGRLLHAFSKPRPQDISKIKHALGRIRDSTHMFSIQECHKSATGHIEQLERLERLLGSNTNGLFEWQEGPLCRALRRGEWLLIDNANLCNPSILDRLNGLMEPNGFLLCDGYQPDGSFSQGPIRII